MNAYVGNKLTYVGMDQFNVDYPVLYTYWLGTRMVLCCEVDKESSSMYEDVDENETFLPVYVEDISMLKYLLHQEDTIVYNIIFFCEDGGEVW